MNIVLIEPFYAGSHATWANGVKDNSQHHVKILSLTGKHWKWRMHGGAISLAKQFLDLDFKPDLILATDMLDLSTFLALTKKSTTNIPVMLYFHENQLSHPWSVKDQDLKKGRDFHYGFINWTSALSADKVLFNSMYNQESFFNEVDIMLKAMPDNRNLDLIELVQSNSLVLPLGIDLNKISFPLIEKSYDKPVIIWNHKWEFDKNPEDFFKALREIKWDGIEFDLIICGEGFEEYPKVFDKLKIDFEKELIHFGYAESKEAYHNLLKQANIIPVTSNQEFFGASVIEAIAAGCFPLLPNALAYPEHIPESLLSVFLYNSTEELAQNLRDICTNLTTVRQLTSTLQQHIMKYDWKNIIPLYDETFSALA